MIYNLIVLIIIICVIISSKKRYGLGFLVAFYYGVYLLLEVDYHGLTVGDVYPGYNESVIWYLVYTAISSIFSIATILLFIKTDQKTALFYSIWLSINALVCGVSAIFQSFESNSFIIWYNTFQNLNLLVDILVVIVGTDNRIRKTKNVSSIVDLASFYVGRYICINDINGNEVKRCQ